MLNILVTTKEKIYLEATADAFVKFFDKEDIKIESFENEKVNTLNTTNYETLEKTIKLTKSGKTYRENFDYFIGIKSGIEYIERDIFYYFWVVIYHNNKIGKARSLSFSVPSEFKNKTENILLSDLIQSIEKLTKDKIIFKNILEETIILAIINLFY